MLRIDGRIGWDIMTLKIINRAGAFLEVVAARSVVIFDVSGMCHAVCSTWLSPSTVACSGTTPFACCSTMYICESICECDATLSRPFDLIAVSAEADIE